MLSFVKRTSLNLVLRHLTSPLAKGWNRFILKKEKQKLISCSRRRWRNDELQWTVCGSLETNYQLSNMEWKRARWDWRRTCWVTTWHYKDNQIICGGYYMTERRYEISHQVSKIISHVDCVHSWNIFHHKSRNLLSPSGHTMFCLLYEQQWNPKPSHFNIFCGLFRD